MARRFLLPSGNYLILEKKLALTQEKQQTFKEILHYLELEVELVKRTKMRPLHLIQSNTCLRDESIEGKRRLMGNKTNGNMLRSRVQPRISPR